ncbi:MAG: hypothetical protein HKN45_02845, partial [Flavobacteriales bacterium]|nr:hypothetical protein [Flavobacteriales bacterium]
LQTLLGGLKIDPETYETLIVMINMGFTVWSLLMLMPLFLFSSFFSFWSAYESETAESLKTEIEKIGTRNKAYGILREES